ncbi:MAG: hypothetical protein DRQ48_11170, partial [Gammaproteobacteria bacterium]
KQDLQILYQASKRTTQTTNDSFHWEEPLPISILASLVHFRSIDSGEELAAVVKEFLWLSSIYGDEETAGVASRIATKAGRVEIANLSKTEPGLFATFLKFGLAYWDGWDEGTPFAKWVTSYLSTKHGFGTNKSVFKMFSTFIKSLPGFWDFYQGLEARPTETRRLKAHCHSLSEWQQTIGTRPFQRLLRNTGTCCCNFLGNHKGTE